MNTCDTCKYWSPEKQTDVPDMHPCDCMVMARGSSMTVADGEPFNGGRVVTGPKFGCVHHEPK